VFFRSGKAFALTVQDLTADDPSAATALLSVRQPADMWEVYVSLCSFAILMVLLMSVCVCATTTDISIIVCKSVYWALKTLSAGLIRLPSLMQVPIFHFSIHDSFIQFDFEFVNNCPVKASSNKLARLASAGMFTEQQWRKVSFSLCSEALCYKNAACLVAPGPGQVFDYVSQDYALFAIFIIKFLKLLLFR
jgi:hypothetical protein